MASQSFVFPVFIKLRLMRSYRVRNKYTDADGDYID